ncbi:MAG: metal-dependent transcriptional regulator [Candidatus Bathyarchaeum sp.]|nr:MAG: metal-dependent transcriptional regulator [Candidatus Bathyarchaeum sp.]
MPTEEASISYQAEEYLEAIYRLEKKRGSAKTMELARKLEVVPGSVTNTIESLERRGLVIHEPYKGVKLTEKGRKLASNVLRKHRLAERLLTDILHLDWSEVHDAACKLEHALSPEILDPLENALGHPKTCPHGNPIPTKNGRLLEEKSKPLADLNSGENGVIVKIADEKPTTLKVLDSLGLIPGSYVKIEEKGSFNGPLNIHVNGQPHTVERELARYVHVKPSNTNSGGTKRD